MSNEKTEELWNILPKTVYVGLGQRGREAIGVEQCWLPGCDNTDKNMLEPFEKNEIASEKNNDGSYFICQKVKTKCKKCGGTFQFALRTIFLVPKSDNNEEKKEAEPYTGMLYILDENGKNIGFAGYC